MDLLRASYLDGYCGGSLETRSSLVLYRKDVLPLLKSSFFHFLLFINSFHFLFLFFQFFSLVFLFFPLLSESMAGGLHNFLHIDFYSKSKKIKNNKKK